MAIDITERKRAEQALRRSEAEFKALVEAAPHHVWTAGPDGALDWFNPRVYDYSGAASGELAGRGWSTIIHPDDAGPAGDKWRQALAAAVFYETEFRLRRHDGVYRWFISRAVPIRDAALTERIGLYHRATKYFSPLQQAAVDALREFAAQERTRTGSALSEGKISDG